MTLEFDIRNEEHSDLEQVSAILRATFPTEAESRLVDALRENGRAVISLVAVNDDNVLGHILFSPVSTTPPGNANGVGLAPVAIRPDMQSKSIGSQLIRHGLRLCKELGIDYCVVLGSPKYYHRFGFEEAGRSDLQNEYGVDEEFMVVRFSNRSLAGLVKYAPEFAMFSV
jgi:putative acetyltransferase